VAVDAALAERVLARISEAELVALALEIANVESPPGAEGPAGDLVYEWCVEHGFDSRRIGMFEDRFNVVAELPGSGSRPSLAFNSHLDTAWRRDDWLVLRDPGNAVYHGGWESGDRLVGIPVVNDKGPMAAFMVAAKALVEGGVRLEGSVFLTMVAGEIGQEPVDEFQGKDYLSKDVGARYLLTHGPKPDFCLNAEGTFFRKGWVEAGKAFFKITVYGGQATYTPFLARPYDPAAEPSAIVRAARLVGRLEEWALEYERRKRYDCPGGTVVPKVNIGAIRGGAPWMICVNPELCMLYLDVRTVPGQNASEIRRELRELVAGEGLEARVDQFVNRPAYEAKGIEPLSDALDAAHEHVFGTPCELADPVVCSMWRDHLVFNELGIPGLTYGPPAAQSLGEHGGLAKADLLRAAQVYALTALAFCGPRG
jgi:acetylornithine deacetylase/succinyl-diaminopimelate desuccinylase-like protein